MKKGNTDQSSIEKDLYEKISCLLELFPSVDLGVLVNAVRQEDTLEAAIDYVLAQEFTELSEQPIEPPTEPSCSATRDHSTHSVDPIVQEIHGQVSWLDVKDVEAYAIAHSDLSPLSIIEQLKRLRIKAITSSRKQRIPLELNFLDYQVVNKAQQSLPKMPAEEQDDKLPVNIYRRFTSCHEAIIKVLAGDTYDELDFSASPEDLRQMALDIHEQRVTQLYKAASVYNERDKLGGSIAQYYAGESHQLSRRMERFNRQAAALTYYCRNIKANNPSDTIDLHGLTVVEAISVVEVVIKMISTRSMAGSSIKIIVGAGRHSAMRQRLRPAVETRLFAKGIPFSYDGNAVFTINFPR